MEKSFFSVCCSEMISRAQYKIETECFWSKLWWMYVCNVCATYICISRKMFVIPLWSINIDCNDSLYLFYCIYFEAFLLVFSCVIAFALNVVSVIWIRMLSMAEREKKLEKRFFLNFIWIHKGNDCITMAYR